MAWMLRWWQAILSALQGNDRELHGWVEPSNAITRAILTAPLPGAAMAAAQPVSQAAAEPVAPAAEAPLEAETAPAVRTRRRRWSRAA